MKLKLHLPVYYPLQVLRGREGRGGGVGREGGKEGGREGGRKGGEGERGGGGREGGRGEGEEGTESEGREGERRGRGGEGSEANNYGLNRIGERSCDCSMFCSVFLCPSFHGHP